MEARDTPNAALTDPDHASSTSGTYVLRDLIKDVPLSADVDDPEVRITCVDSWNGNLYIGTSAAELLHFVSIPPDPSDEASQPSYILASRLQPPFKTQQEPPDGVKQILILPAAGKACILCNGTLTFYTLPELSPAFGGKIQQAGCTWVGGLDSNDEGSETDTHGGTSIVICLKQRLRLIRIGEEARKIRDIELGGVLALQRRGDLACVADGKSYSLLDVVNQRKNDLFPIASAIEEPVPALPSRADLTPPGRQASRSFSNTSPVREGRGHNRNASLHVSSRQHDQLRPDSNVAWPARNSSRRHVSSPQPAIRDPSPQESAEARTEEQQAPSAIGTEPSAPVIPSKPLLPHILSPTASEFLLVTGTRVTEPAVGMFVNLDGDVSRGTLEFSSYPSSLVLDNDEDASSISASGESAGHALALVQTETATGLGFTLEIQRWAGDSGETTSSKEWLHLTLSSNPSADGQQSASAGLRQATSSAEIGMFEVSTTIRLRRLARKHPAEVDNDKESRRNAEEDRFAARFSAVNSNVLLYSDSQVQWLVRNPLLVQLDSQLKAAVQHNTSGELAIDVHVAQRIVNGVRGQEPKSELEFLTLTYIRQKASLLLFGYLLMQTSAGVIAYEHDKRRAEEALAQGDIDPRVVLDLVSPLADEVVEGSDGIWIPQGLRDTADMLREFRSVKMSEDVRGPYGDNLLGVIKRYLSSWRKKKGFGSVADETHVFQSVDAALLHVLLLLDQHSPRGPATPGSIRAELNDVVDKGVDCFERAVKLFEQFQRLHLLSRLYQSKRLSAKVLGTWKRILEGEHDEGGELIEGEQDIRRYLTKLRDLSLVQDYGAWLADRNPKLGVQVFADDNNKVKFQPAEAVAILKEKAPGAVKDYLEHLVFGKNHVQYVNDLIAFYLDTVLNELEASPESRETLIQSYETYRALRPPKPTYRQFITDNAIDAEWWHNRLRLLQLIGGSHGAASSYDVHKLGDRLSPYSNELVPEMIILNGRQGAHDQALRLLTHGLGDYDTAIRYCLLGGSSIFHTTSSSPLSSASAAETPLPSKQEQSRLFSHLLHEFFAIDDETERLERTAELLERFAQWFDLAEVLGMLPDSWNVEQVSGFLVHALRALVRERNETVVVKALSGAQNLKRSAEFGEKVGGMKAVVVRREGVGGVDGGDVEVS
ncbi:hypothetical protein MBLNU230_g7370t1 [Neophaeotheca triangularis]